MQGVKMEKCEQKFTGQHSTEIGVDSKARNSDKYKNQAQSQDQTALKKGDVCFSETVQDASDRRRKIEKRAEPCEDLDAGAGILTVKDAHSE